MNNSQTGLEGRIEALFSSRTVGMESLEAMRVCQLKLNGFRNYRSLDFTPGAGINILHGDNAQGKSNVLEALSLLATTRSLRASRESELIYRESEMAHVTAEVAREREGDVELSVSVYQTDKKAVRVNGLKRPHVVDLLGQFNAVFFGAINLAIVTGEPSDRRHYLNIEISQISPRYVYDLVHYKRVLEQRNRLLRDLRDRPRPPADTGLDVWTEQLVTFGSPLFDRRQFYIDRLAPIAEHIHRDLTDGKETLEVRYAPSFPLPSPVPISVSSAALPAAKIQETPEEHYLADAQRESLSEGERNESAGADRPSTAPESALSGPETIAGAFREALDRVGYDEARRGTTLVGPQRDDLCFLINGADARLYGSQGQQRTVALAIKLAEFQLIADYVGEPPVMLLDDVMSDLDDARRSHLLAWIRGRGQTFITCTSLRAFPKEILAEAATFQVVAGTVTPDARPKSRPPKAAKFAPADPPAPDDGERGKQRQNDSAATGSPEIEPEPIGKTSPNDGTAEAGSAPDSDGRANSPNP